MKLAITPLVLSTATFGLMLGVSQNAQAAGLIPNVTASTTIGSATPGTWNIANTVNGVGLLPSNTPSLTGSHAASSGGTSANAWRSVTNTYTTGTITFNFNRIYNLAGFTFWNLGGSIQLAGQGIKNVTIEYSLNGVDWTTLTGAPTSFAQGPASSGNVPAQVFDFSPVHATNVRFSNMVRNV
ncbi:discoidin domain-containing protein [Microcystis aeruginosa]|uniref:F5/8 type C domain-containing protein n=1 Tax=Microcystis aeruginosa NIES-2521 TaxID=2303983 RepID=A0A5A5S9D4_MICAE|nr:discoidin domain-containing protein [Microcystis aeruginosa]GCA81982.1 hypothetical protein MiTs_04004 [Microcystis aeruginosa NIES-2521]